MSLAAAVVMLVMIWSLVFFVLLPLRLQTQGESGKVEEGTHSSAPEVHHLKKKALITTAVALVIWGIVVAVILLDVFAISDFDIFHRMGPTGGFH